MAFTTFNSSAVSIAFGPFDISEGLADPFFRVEMQGDAYVTKISADGSVCRYATHENRANIQIILSPQSKHNAQLAALHALDANTHNGAGVVTLFVRDGNGTGLHATAQCWIKKLPVDEKGSQTIADKTWEIEAVFQAGSSHPGGW